MTHDYGSEQGKWRLSTRLVRGGTERSNWGETSEALILTSGYAYDSAEQAAARLSGEEPGYVYSRYTNPTVRMLERRLALLEGAEDARVTASGMAAISAAMMAPLKAGDRVVAASALFGSCRWIISELLPRFGVTTEFVDGRELDSWERALSRPAKWVLIESPSNPLLDAVDIAAVARLAHAAGAKLIVDNVFASPVLTRPLEHGADWVVYSATKHMDGQGRVLGGAILGPAADLVEIFDPYLRHTGPALSPFNAWVILKGLETIDLRVERASQTAARLADLVSGHRAVDQVRYPGRADHPQHAIHIRQMSAGGTLMAIRFKGGQAAAFNFLNALELIDISNNLGDSKSLATHPSTTTHRALSDAQQAQMGLDPHWVRLSVGLEAFEDLAADLTCALNAAAAY
jgi:O-succinylhomoserine sulfhydrylase